MRHVVVCGVLVCVIVLALGYAAWELFFPKAGTTAGPAVSINDPRAYQGYTLIAPMLSTTTFLVDMEGRIVHTWKSEHTPAFGARLLDNGNLLRTGRIKFLHPESGGRLEEMSWDGELVWDFTFGNKDQHCHHDAIKLPNGNYLMVIADYKSGKRLSEAGLRSRPNAPRSSFDGLQTDALIEVKPTGKTTGEIVWEWHVWDHLLKVQNKSKAEDIAAAVAEHPERIDLKFGPESERKPMKQADHDKLRGLGYIGDTDGTNRARRWSDWTHINSVDYRADLDQIMISVRAFSEIWIIDHSTTTQEAAGSTGGKYGKGGDLLYRWGNPRAYGMGGAADQQLFLQHNAHWIPQGMPGAGHVLLFNNGPHLDGAYSSVDEIELPLGKDGTYPRQPNLAFGPDAALWSYTAPVKTDFFGAVISGAQRLPNGNTLICSGSNQVVFEVTPQKEIVWKFAVSSEELSTAPAPEKLKTVADAKGGLFRAYRYGVDDPALRGRDLMPGKTFGER